MAAARGVDWRPDRGQPPPEIEPAQRVVCHGDACAPNTLIDHAGRWAGHVDLGGLGIGDRWADLAIATWSTEWNYGPGWEGTLLAAYGIPPDPERTRLYRALWGSAPSPQLDLDPARPPRVETAAAKAPPPIRPSAGARWDAPASPSP